MSGTQMMEAVLRREKAIMIGIMAILLIFSWGYMFFFMASEMPCANSGSAISMTHHQGWGTADFLMAFVMWAVMMIGMMVPSVAPWVLALCGVSARDPRSSPLFSAGGFLMGYLAVWTVYSFVAAGLQWGLHTVIHLSPQLRGASPVPEGTLLLVAGIYQWTPLKNACLAHCRSPLGFFLTSWKEGRFGSFQMGFQHGLYCVGCCWALMALSFIAGLMNLLWMAAITIFLLIDHTTPVGYWFTRAAGVLLLGSGIWILAATLVKGSV